MALLKAMALGAIAAISLPFVLHDASGTLGRAVNYGTVHPDAGRFGFPLSIPIFVIVTLFAAAMFRASRD